VSVSERPRSFRRDGCTLRRDSSIIGRSPIAARGEGLRERGIQTARARIRTDRATPRPEFLRAPIQQSPLHPSCFSQRVGDRARCRMTIASWVTSSSSSRQGRAPSARLPRFAAASASSSHRNWFAARSIRTSAAEATFRTRLVRDSSEVAVDTKSRQPRCAPSPGGDVFQESRASRCAIVACRGVHADRSRLMPPL
jgi:hypothetical protein